MNAEKRLSFVILEQNLTVLQVHVYHLAGEIAFVPVLVAVEQFVVAQFVGLIQLVHSQQPLPKHQAHSKQHLPILFVNQLMNAVVSVILVVCPVALVCQIALCRSQDWYRILGMQLLFR